MRLGSHAEAVKVRGKKNNPPGVLTRWRNSLLLVDTKDSYLKSISNGKELRILKQIQHKIAVSTDISENMKDLLYYESRQRNRFLFI